MKSDILSELFWVIKPFVTLIVSQKETLGFLLLKGDSNPKYKYVLSKRDLWTMNFDTSIIKIGWKMWKLWAFKEFNIAKI